MRKGFLKQINPDFDDTVLGFCLLLSSFIGHLLLAGKEYIIHKNILHAET